MQRSNRPFRSFLRSIPGALVLIALVSACAAPSPRAPELTREEQVRRERERGSVLALQLESTLSLRDDAVLSSELERLASALGQKSEVRIRIYVPTEALPGPAVVLPGGHWYFSSAALRQLRFDNELAAFVAAAMAVSELRTEAAAGDQPAISESEWRSANRRMVALLYAAGFDPRGVPSFWRKTRAPKLFEEEAHLEIARRAPLLNPVVRTPRFGEIEKRLRRL